jgi:hypothetical protein
MIVPNDRGKLVSGKAMVYIHLEAFPLTQKVDAALMYVIGYKNPVRHVRFPAEGRL